MQMVSTGLIEAQPLQQWSHNWKRMTHLRLCCAVTPDMTFEPVFFGRFI